MADDGDRYYEDIAVGDQYESPGRTVTEADLVLFAGVSGDYNVLHTNAELMKSSIFGERIAHGLLGMAIQSGLLFRVLRPPYAALALAGLRWKFKAPIKIGDTIRVRARVSAKQETKPDRGLVTLERQVLNQRDEVVQEGETDIVVARRG
jgi:acyl dehydratase